MLLIFIMNSEGYAGQNAKPKPTSVTAALPTNKLPAKCANPKHTAAIVELVTGDGQAPDPVRVDPNCANRRRDYVR